MRYLLAILLLCSLAYGQEIRRPTADVDGGGSDPSDTMTAAYDAGTPPTTTYNLLSVTGPRGDLSNHNSCRIFTTWQSAGSTYSSLTLNVNTSWLKSGTATVSCQYSTDSGLTWNPIGACSSSIQHTYSLTLSTLSVSGLQVELCVSATGGSSSVSTSGLSVWDVWTVGTGGSKKHSTGSWR